MRLKCRASRPSASSSSFSERETMARELLAPCLRVIRNASTAGGFKQVRDAVHTSFACDSRRGRPILVAPEIRIGAVLQKELHDFERLVLLLRQPEERRGLPGRLGQAWFGAEDFAEPVDIANWGEVPDVAAVAPQQIDHARELIVRGEIERRVAVVQL